MKLQRGPQFDRILMRAKDFIIIGSAIVAMFKWFYVNPMEMESRMNRQDQLFGRLTDKLEKIEEHLASLDKKINEKNVRTYLDQ